MGFFFSFLGGGDTVQINPVWLKQRINDKMYQNFLDEDKYGDKTRVEPSTRHSQENYPKVSKKGK